MAVIKMNEDSIETKPLSRKLVVNLDIDDNDEGYEPSEYMSNFSTTIFPS